MNFKTRFILLALFNISLMAFFFYICLSFGDIASKRLIDLSLGNAADKSAFFSFAMTLFAAFLGNFAILTLRKNDFTKREAEELLTLLKAN